MTPPSTAVSVCRDGVWPSGDASDASWLALRLAAEERRTDDMLVHADRWFDALVFRAQQVFRVDVTDDPAAVQRNAIDKRAFMDAWLARPTPVLLLEDGRFVLHPTVGAPLIAAALRAGRLDEADVWQARTSRTLPSACTPPAR